MCQSTSANTDSPLSCPRVLRPSLPGRTLSLPVDQWSELPTPSCRFVAAHPFVHESRAGPSIVTLLDSRAWSSLGIVGTAVQYLCLFLLIKWHGLVGGTLRPRDDGAFRATTFSTFRRGPVTLDPVFWSLPEAMQRPSHHPPGWTPAPSPSSPVPVSPPRVNSFVNFGGCLGLDSTCLAAAIGAAWRGVSGRAMGAPRARFGEIEDPLSS